MYICIYVYMYICIYVYMYICICVYVYMCICVYVYVYTDESCRRSGRISIFMSTIYPSVHVEVTSGSVL